MVCCGMILPLSSLQQTRRYTACCLTKPGTVTLAWSCSRATRDFGFTRDLEVKCKSEVRRETDADVVQAGNSLDGAVVDEVTLTKPPGWRPDQSARLHTLALFHANYTPTWLELSGINGPAEELILRPAEALLFSEPELLESLRNATLVQVSAFTADALHPACPDPHATLKLFVVCDFEALA